jgi:hypothetical protein
MPNSAPVRTRLIFIALAVFSCNTILYAQDKPAIAATADALFDAMREGNGDGVRAVFAPDAILERVSGEGEMERNSVDDFAKSVAGWQPNQIDERVFEVAIQQFEHLATMWAPFTLKVDGELKACGINQITLGRLEQEWKIIHLVDRHYAGDCKRFIAMMEND